MRIHFTSLRVRQFGTGALFLLAYFVAVLAALHYLRPDYAPSRHMISDYAVGPYGWLMTSAFVALGACCLLLMLGLASAGPRSITARFAAALYGVAFVGLVMTATFPTDLPGAPATASGDIHNATFLINVGSLLLATVLLTVSFGRDPTWRPLLRVGAVAACFVVAAFGLQFFTLRPGAPYGLAGTRSRLMEGQMNWEALGAIGDFVGAIGVVVTLVYLSLQIRSSARATEAQVHASLSAEMERVIVAISQNDSLVEAMQTAQGGGDLTAAQRIKLTYWFGGFLRVCESHIIQRRLGSTNIGLEGPISKLLLQFAQIIFFRSMMKDAVEGGIATDEFLAWLDSNVLSRIGAQQRGAA